MIVVIVACETARDCAQGTRTVDGIGVGVGPEECQEGRQSAGSGITFDSKSSPLSPAPPSLVPGHPSLVATAAAIIPLPAFTVLGLDWSDGVHRRLLPELQPPPLTLRHWWRATAVALLQDALAGGVVLVGEAWCLEGRVATLVETRVASCWADGRWLDRRADHGHGRGQVEGK